MGASAALVSAGVAVADDLTGQASVIDGDTLEIHGTHIRAELAGSTAAQDLPK